MPVNDSGCPVLYSFRRCPYAIRGRMALVAAGIRCELREVILRDKPAEMLAVSAKGTVPVLQLADGRIIDESLALMHWALAQRDPENWLQADKVACNALIDKNDREFKDRLDRYKYHVRFPDHTQVHYRREAEEFIGELETTLQGHHGKGLVEPRTTLADIAIFPFVRQFSRVDPEWFRSSPYTDLVHWLEALEQHYLFTRIMKKYSPWQAGEARVYLEPLH